MCGIITILSKNTIKLSDSIKELQALEYRGYDSFGYYYLNTKNNEFHTTKHVSLSIKEHLKTLHSDVDINYFIGHTRWATHGDICTSNTQPYPVVINDRIVGYYAHNGIISNYKSIDKTLKNDSKAIRVVLESNPNDDPIKLFNTKLEGSFSIVYLDILNNEVYYYSKDKSLVLEIEDEKIIISSSIRPSTKSYYRIDNCSGSIKLDEHYVNIDHLPPISIKNNVSKVSCLTQYDHSMLNEIYDQINLLSTEPPSIKLSLISDIFAIGSSYNAVCAGLSTDKTGLCNKNIRVHNSTRDTPLPDNYDFKSEVLFVSQSGESKDIIDVARKFNTNIVNSLSLTNTPNNTLSNLCVENIELGAGPEYAVAATKSFLQQYRVFKLSISDNFEDKNLCNDEYKNDFKLLHDIAKSLAKSIIKYPVYSIIYDSSIISKFLIDECILKIHEVSYKPCLGFSIQELKHGPLALFSKSEMTVYPLLLNYNNEPLENNIAYSLLRTRKVNGNIINYPLLKTLTEDYMTIIFFQFLTYELAIMNGINPDKPRNLAKSVTV